MSLTPADSSASRDRPAGRRGGSGLLRVCVVVFIVALGARAAWGTYRLVRAADSDALEFPDEEQYWLMASNLWRGEGLTDEFGFHATRMPLYPGLLAPLTGAEHGVVIAKVFQWMIGASAAALTALLAATLFDRWAVTWLAGLAVAVDPFLVFSSSLLLTETLFVVAGLVLWQVAARWVTGGSKPVAWSSWLVLGIVSGATVYVREAGLVLVGLLLVFLLAARRIDRGAVLGVAAAVAVVAAMLLPWAVRNHEVTGAWCWTTHRGGISLYDGVRPDADGASDLADIQQSPEVAGMDEVAWNRHFLDKSFALIQADPWRIARLAVVKLIRTWNPVPNVETYQSAVVRVVSAAWMVPTLAFAVAGAIIMSRRRMRGDGRYALFLLLPALQVCVLHSLFVGSVRYRLGAMPMIEILAAVAVVALLDRLRARTATGPN